MSELTFLKAAHEDIDRTFREVLPRHGYMPREGQIALAHTMLDALAKGQIALADAGVGVGKTDAYIVAAAILQEHQPQSFARGGKWEIGEGNMPFVISTSSIPLQRAILEDYIPLLSRALLDAGIISKPFSGEIRKGKRNYACRDRVLHRISTANLDRKNPAQREALQKLTEEFDLDRVPHLSRYDRTRVCVPDNCPGKGKEACENTDRCPYMRHIMHSKQHPALFQICNHHFLLMDAKHRTEDRPALLSAYRGLIVDEAHLLYEAAQSVCGQEITAKGVQQVMDALRREGRGILANRLQESLEQLFHTLIRQTTETGLLEQDMACKEALKKAQASLKAVRQNLPSGSRSLAHRLDNMKTVLDRVHGRNDGFHCFLELDGDGHPALRTVAKEHRAEFQRLLWDKRIGFVLTSGTLAAGRDMDFTKSRLGLTGDSRMVESVTPSPFDYAHNSLLYLPKEMPFCNDREHFREAAAEEIAKLIRATHGHTLVLFTSYTELKDVYDRLKEKELPYSLFAMFGRKENYLAAFRDSGNGVLLNTRMEGANYPGDQVSSVIIPRLPFPRRDAIHQGSKGSYRETRQFVREVALPEMLLKLRQATGRGMRLMTDTCVISILDSRCAPGGSYHRDVLAALPPYPMTQELADVETFIRERKDASYFAQEAAYAEAIGA